MLKIISVGNALVDVITMIDNELTLQKLLLRKGSMQLVNEDISAKIRKETENFRQILACGGSAANTIRALARINVETCFIGKVGKDEYGTFYASDMKNAGVETHFMLSETPTGRAIALILPDAERTFATFLGAGGELLPEEIKAEIFIGYDIFHVEGYLVYNQELIEKAVKTAKKCGLKISLDMASFNVVEDNLEFLKYLAKNYVDIIFANEEEAKAFTGKEPREALDVIAEMCEIAVVKIGDKGSFVKTNDFIHYEPALNINPLDSTGAGDFYAAGFLYGLIHNMDLSKCAKIGTLLAGNVMEFEGPRLDEKRWCCIKEQLGIAQQSPTEVGMSPRGGCRKTEGGN